MNLATPILICHENEDFRTLLRDMLTKHGFFHVLDTSSNSDLNDLMKKEVRPTFLIIDVKLLNEEMILQLLKNKYYLIISRQNDEGIVSTVARLGVNHFLSFPFPSQRLVEKINAVAQ